MHLMQNDTTPIQKTLRRRLKPEGQVALLGERGVELRHERIGVPTEFGGAASDACANRRKVSLEWPANARISDYAHMSRCHF